MLSVKNFPLFSQIVLPRDPYINRVLSTTDSLESPERDACYVVQLKNGAKRTSLNSSNMKIVRSLDDRHFVVRGDVGSIRASNKIVPIGRASVEWKLEKSLVFEHDSLKSDFIVRVSARDALQHVMVLAVNMKPRVLGETALLVSAFLGEIRRNILPIDDVVYVGLESTRPKGEARVLDLYLGPNGINKVHRDYPKYDGSGMTLSVKELRIDEDDPDLLQRYTSSPFAADQVDQHATEMATIAAGAGNSFVTGKGVAPACLVSSSDFANLMPDPDDYFDEVNAWTQNHSYGTVVENQYGVMAEAYDENAVRLPLLLHVFSAGNSGTETPTNGPYAGIAGVANLTGNFKMAKNLLTVGAVDTLGNPQSFSSRGPAFDGRVKPELVAYSSQGSSNAAALVSGIAVVMQDAYYDKHGEYPEAALLKALLINSASDAGPEGIDFMTGYGNVDGIAALDALANGQYYSGVVGHGQSEDFVLNVPINAAELKVTLVWNDPPALPGSGKTLINDLDLLLENTGSGNFWMPWVLDHEPGADILERTAERRADHVNNVEQVTIEGITAGNYRIVVSGFDIPQGPQKYFVAYQWAPANQFEWRYPTMSDNFPYDGETGTYFFWNSTRAESTGILQIKRGENEPWQTIAETVPLKKEAFRWTQVPPGATTAEARMIIGSDTLYTERFTISRPMPVSLGFNCGDSVMIKWHPLAGANAYRIFVLDPEKPVAEPILLTKDTSIVLQKSTLPSARLAIQPVVDGRDALRWPMFDYNALGTQCFVSFFTNSVLPEEGILLHLQLGTTYGIDHIDIERQDGGQFRTIGTLTPTSSSLEFLDADPNQGLNRYRAALYFVNGESFATDVTEEFFLTTLPFVVFPNPVVSGTEVAVFSKSLTAHAVFRLYRTDGTLLKTFALLSDRESIPIESLSPGVYIYSIAYPEGVFNGRLVVK